jgi:hypothetical protein
MKIPAIALLVAATLIGLFVWRGHGSDERLAWASSDTGESGIHFAVEGLWNEQLVVWEDDPPVSDSTIAWLAVSYYSDRFRAAGFRTVRVGSVVENVWTGAHGSHDRKE